MKDEDPSIPPWKRSAPKKATKTKLTPEQIAVAKASAKKAGRPYPNLIDNMMAARKAKAEKEAEKEGKAEAGAAES